MAWTEVQVRRIDAAEAEAWRREDLRLYTARLDGQIAGACGLAVIDGVAYLSLGVTREEAQGRGVHTAMLHARIREAQALGCDLLTSLVAADSGSQPNLERAGLTVVGDRTTWLPPDWTSHPFYADSA
jgi:GNAT superfamily N-acetyltransferase